MARKPVAAGMFYEDDFDELDKQIVNSFEDDKFGPGSLPGKRGDREIKGVIAPHAGYAFSGGGAAWCYKEIAESQFADVYVIIGTSHTGANNACLLIDDFETPFGTVKVDEEFCKSLIAKGGAIENKVAHEQEHSIEVQLPYLQFVSKDRLDDLRIVPIVVGQGADYKRLAKAIANTAKQMEIRIVLICSSDFTHYGINYAYLPFTEDVKDNLENLDMKAIQWIQKLDSWSFLNYIDETQATICGKDAIAVFIEYCKELNADKVRLEHYYTSGDVTKDYVNAVGYASIIVD